MARKRPLAALLQDWFLEFPALVKLVYRLWKDDRVSTIPWIFCPMRFSDWDRLTTCI